MAGSGIDEIIFCAFYPSPKAISAGHSDSRFTETSSSAGSSQHEPRGGPRLRPPGCGRGLVVHAVRPEKPGRDYSEDSGSVFRLRIFLMIPGDFPFKRNQRHPVYRNTTKDTATIMIYTLRTVVEGLADDKAITNDAHIDNVAHEPDHLLVAVPHAVGRPPVLLGHPVGLGIPDAA